MTLAMRRLLLAVFLLLGLMPALTSQAQSPASTLEQLAVDIWPDFDQPSVLFLMTGTLPASAPSPATVTIPIPADATINAVARVNSGGSMIADIDFDDSTPGRLTLTTPDPNFRVEYYMPYETVDGRTTFTFDWQADLTVDEMLTSVQQPALATTLTTTPPAAEVSTGQDGLQYHYLPPEAVPAGERYSVSSSYTMARQELTAEVVSEQQPSPIQPPASSQPSQSSDAGFNWALMLAVMGGLIILAAAIWFIVSGRSSKSRSGKSRILKPKPAGRATANRPSKKATARSSGPKYCHECGTPIEPGDRFCRNCGAALKST